MIEMMEIAKTLVILLHELKLLWILKDRKYAKPIANF